MFSCEFCEMSKNTFLHRTPLVAASVMTKKTMSKDTNSRKVINFTPYLSADPFRVPFKQQESFKQYPQAVVLRCSVKKLFLEISENSQENTCARVSF